jgi:hypothetical protein
MFAAFQRMAAIKRTCAIGATIALAGASMAFASTSATAAEIVITVTKFHALDKADELSSGDFFARMKINGKAAFSSIITGDQEFSPNWKLTLPAKAGVNEVNLALIDKDVSVDDPIDINRLDKKRDLDFTVNTKTCKIEGFNQTYKCGQSITRAGGEKKKASITFTVDVNK